MMHVCRCHCRRTSRAGFTLLELLVTIGIVGLLLALLLPAVQSTREAARRVECGSHIRQIILAAHNYEATYKAFPGPETTAGHWYVQILPFVEQAAIAALYDAPTFDEQTVELFRCPSDPLAVGRAQPVNINYRPNDGVLWGEGFIRREGQQVRARDVTDGLSATAAFSERLAWPVPLFTLYNPPSAFPEYWDRHHRRTATTLTDLDEYADACMATQLPPSSTWNIVLEYNHIVTPNGNSCLNGPTLISSPIATTANSLHPGGVHVALGDGSVRFTSDHVDRHVWRAIGTRSGGESASF